MVINSEEELKRQIEDLKNKSKAAKQNILNDFSSFSSKVNPVYQINKILPKPASFANTFNLAMDEALLESALSITKKFKSGSTSSIIKVAGNNMLDNAVKMVVKKNTFKIKVYGAAILKNLFK